MERAGALWTTVVFIVVLTTVEAYICYFGQEPDPESIRQCWVLSAALRSPCVCTGFRLGGVNTVASQHPDGGSCFGWPPLSETPEKILNCQRAPEYSTYLTGKETDILFPFAEFVPPLEIAFEVTMTNQSAGIARVYLAKMPRVDTMSPPYMIELGPAEVTVSKLNSPIYERISTAAISEAFTDGHYSVHCEYRNAGSSLYIEVELSSDTGSYEASVQAFDDYAEEVRYVGLYSTVLAEWKFQNP